MAEVSVIVPVYNAEKTLSRSVESVLAQTELDWELWLFGRLACALPRIRSGRSAHPCD